MSLAAIASNLYTIQSKKNVPLKTAFSMMVREDMAMRFSVYNLVRIITKSEFLATVAQTAYGKRTPMQRMQDEEERKAAEKEKQFKVYTQVTFARINNRLNLLTNIAERNYRLITNLYTELGYFRGQRRMSVNAGVISATRIPTMSKTVKGRLDQLQDEIQGLKKLQKKKPLGRPVGSKAKKKPTKQEAEQSLSILLANPRLLAMVAASAAGLGTLAAIGTSLANAPGVVRRTLNRFSGQPGSENADAEAALKAGDPALAAISVGSLVGGTMYGAKLLKNKFGKKESGIQTINRLTQMQRAKNPALSYREAQKKAGETATRYTQAAKQLKKWKYLSGPLRALGKLAPAAAAADIAFTVSRMSGYVSDHSMGKMNDKEFEEKMTTDYAQLISTVGIGGVSTAIGALAGTAAFPGLGTGAGLIAGGAAGMILSVIVDEENNESLRAIANKVFKMLHDDESASRKSEPSLKEQVSGAAAGKQKPNQKSFIDSVKEFMGISTGAETPSTPATPTGPKDGPLSVRNNNPGNLRYDKNFTGSGGVLEGALPAEKGSYAIFPTPELGIEGMRRQVVLDTQKRKKTLREFISKYAPKKDNNDTENYIKFVSNETGVPPDGLVPLDRIRQLMYYMIKMEGGEAAVAYYKPYLTISAQGTARETVGVPPQARPPTVATTPNQDVRPPSDIPTVDMMAAQRKESQTAEINAQAGLLASEAISRKLNAGLREMGSKIMDVERQVPPLSPFVTNPESSILSYRKA